DAGVGAGRGLDAAGVGVARCPGGLARGDALGIGLGEGVGVRVPGRLKCSRPGIVCGPLCATAAADTPSTKVSASAPRIEETKNPTGAPLTRES
ncbi:hypothetical protein QH494_23350, partial [Sphingomonas sp. AR_OL41]|uniref:hypothetical protein n=1 Tax=Sphingomonas sp. AR_OL41 TaxID=3042729 RepID=UPI00247FA699